MSLHVLFFQTKKPPVETLLSSWSTLGLENVDWAGTHDDALSKALSRAPDVIIAEDEGASKTIQEFCASIREHYPFLPVIVVSHRFSEERALEMFRSGAFDCIPNSVNMNELGRKASLAAEKHAVAYERFRQMAELKTANDQLLQNLAQEYARNIQSDERLAGFEQRVQPEHHRISELFLGEGDDGFHRKEELLRFARSSAMAILLLGEKNTGKRTLASFIHQQSSRRDMPFISLNCNHPNSGVLEKELLGFERGSLTTSNEGRAGVFEMAQGGTVFLTNVHCLPPNLQGALHRILETRSVRRLGADSDRPFDTRVVATTHLEPEQLIHDEHFLESLMDTLSVLTFSVPKLNERGKDILNLTQTILADVYQEYGKTCPSLSHDVEIAFLKYPWSGNLRELRNVLERICLLHDSKTIEIQHLPDNMQVYAKGSTPREMGASKVMPLGSLRAAKEKVLKGFEEEYIVTLMAKHQGNVTVCAREAGIERSNFLRLIRKYNLKSDSFRKAG